MHVDCKSQTPEGVLKSSESLSIEQRSNTRVVLNSNCLSSAHGLRFHSLCPCIIFIEFIKSYYANPKSLSLSLSQTIRLCYPTTSACLPSQKSDRLGIYIFNNRFICHHDVPLCFTYQVQEKRETSRDRQHEPVPCQLHQH